MKQIDIIIPRKRLNEVNDILYKHKVGGLSFYDIKGRGQKEQKSVPVRVQGYATRRTHVPKFGIRTKLEVLVPDSLVKLLIHDLLATLSTGRDSVGKIFVKDVTEAYDIGSKQSGDVALG
ncbi:MAG: P-II family nitrogen regulator, partial [Candidatus Nitrosopolaris sp.]